MLNIIYLKELVVGLMEYIYQESTTSTDPKQTFLYKLLYGNKDGKVDFYQQALSIYARTPGNPRRISVSLEYPKDKSNLPVYVIREPGKTKGPANTVGKIEGIYSGEYGGIQYADSRESNYEIMCFSDNMIESIIMSEILYALLVSSHDILAQQFDTIDFSMKELMVNNELIPVPIFIKSVGVNVSCRELIPGLGINEELLGKILFQDAGISAMSLTENNSKKGMPGAESEIL